METLIVPFVLVNLWGVHINPYEVVSLYGDQRTCTLSLRNSHQWTVTPTPEELAKKFQQFTGLNRRQTH